MASLTLDTKMSSLALNNQKDFAYDFYKKYLWKELSENGEQKSGWILRTIYCQFGNWCVKKKYSIDDVLIHDEKNKIQGLLLSELSYDKKFPTPLGIIYKEEKPTYETMLYDQIEKSVQSKGKGNLDKLFNDSHTWNV